ncbi:MAG: hypothetical protein IT167_19500 [Bryobacterales bacterium]|nr:hypothetical protein [Bryobacterales bacterium]
MKEVCTRFAPGPTGWLHIGGVRTALFEILFAHRHGSPTQVNLRPQSCVFQAIAESISPMWGCSTQAWTGATASRRQIRTKPDNVAGGPRCSHRPDEFRPAIP